MKRVLILTIVMAFVASASAQTILDLNFEDGTIGKWIPWQKKMENLKVVTGNKAKDGNYAVSYRTGMMHGIANLKEGTTYKISFDSDNVWGKSSGYAAIHGYNKETEKLEEVARAEVPIGKGYKVVEFTYKAKFSSFHRITLAPGGNGGEFIVDNLKIEVVK